MSAGNISRGDLDDGHLKFFDFFTDGGRKRKDLEKLEQVFQRGDITRNEYERKKTSIQNIHIRQSIRLNIFNRDSLQRLKTRLVIGKIKLPARNSRRLGFSNHYHLIELNLFEHAAVCLGTIPRNTTVDDVLIYNYKQWHFLHQRHQLVNQNSRQ